LLLSARRERPCCRHAADKRDERASSHSITSSARASSVGDQRRLAITKTAAACEAAMAAFAKSGGAAEWLTYRPTAS
jgi:hypothetical protein